MSKKILCGIAAFILATLACSTLTGGHTIVVGSGHEIGEPRNVANFTSVELSGSADVNILLSDAQSVNVQGDDNIVPLIETTVKNDTLIVGTKPFTDIQPSSRVVVTVAMKSLQGASLSGSGNVNIGAMIGPELVLRLSGSGNITAQGTVDHLMVNLPGSGNVDGSQLKARSANVTLAGSGDIFVNVSEALDASISGSGSIHYQGNPARITKSITGSGTISP